MERKDRENMNDVNSHCIEGRDREQTLFVDLLLLNPVLVAHQQVFSHVILKSSPQSQLSQCYLLVNEKKGSDLFQTAPDYLDQ